VVNGCGDAQASDNDRQRPALAPKSRPRIYQADLGAAETDAQEQDNVLLPRPTPIPLPTANQKHWPSQRWRRGIDVQPILYPGVKERAVRQRFFINRIHSEEQIRRAIAIINEEWRQVSGDRA
jgi:7-keto-8-aminopelargonate synthetase-like enzyme